MNILNKLTIKHLKQNKKRTVVTIIGIILSTALMVGIGLLFATVRDNSIKTIKSNFGSHHVLIKMPIDNLDVIKNNKNISSYKYKSSIGYSLIEEIENEYKPYIEIFSADKNYLNELNLIDGRLPNNNKEIVISNHLLENNSLINLKIGDKITLNVGKRIDIDGNILNSNNSYQLSYNCEDEQCKKINEHLTSLENLEFTIVGICKRDVLEPYSSPGYSAFTISNDSDILDTYITYTNIKKAYDNTEKLIANLGIEIDNVTYNDSLLVLFGVSQYGNLTESLTEIICIVLSLVSIGCIVVIYNSFAISVMERKKQFGLFSSIGTTKKQLKYTVFYEALIVSLIGIPLGILSAYLGIGLVLKIVNYLLPNVFEFELSLVTYKLFLIIPIIFMLITIFISAYIPARLASKISPIEAIRQNDDIKIKSKKIKSPKFIRKIFGVEGEIAYKNIKRNRKKYRITIISLFVSIVLFISFSSFVKYGLESSFDYSNLPKYDYIVTINGSYKFIDKINDISNQIINSSDFNEYVEYANTNIYDFSVSLEYSQDIKETTFYNEKYTKINYINLIGLSNKSYNEYINKLGLKDKKIIIANEYSNIEYINNTRKAINVPIFDIVSDLKILNYNFENIYLTEELPLGITTNIDALTIIVDNETFNELFDKEYNYDKTIILKGGNYSDTDKIISDNNKDLISCYGYNIKEEQKLISNMILVVKILLYGFVSLVTLIGVTSVLNTINTSISLRRKEFAVLRSIGLTPKGFNKILLFESLFFGLKSLLYSIPVAIFIVILLHLSFNGIVTFNNILFPFDSILIAIVGVFIIIIICMFYSSNKIKSENILEAIRNENI